MHTLYPLLDDGAASTGCATGSPMRDGDVLSPELRENFDTMRALIRQEKKRKDAPHDNQEVEDQLLQTKKRQVAVKTALAVEDEMSRLRNGIAELEALLAQQEQGGDFDAGLFHALPPIVPSEEDDVAEVGNDEREDKQLDGKMVHG
mmetsp:Transcript_3167/g.5203  ORF Transcript_3167/g.5203 Transcript_3167/m.5203 type:complete len:147 (-) Transcript_3167:123-563(-)|eukprot:CAMPEP_0119006586 /NCGR_PEP_ID=MMETSP1176-20130426/2389_1 /TAXON_ID=265551 /ORGANISM="Synedropsis recta cf, Strain CCMP1620" /LENGTH=146 /DNA_ID=CAMNT_0006958517 /DNA_START=301 /DNA_END=741 /DNA_ORIENTATION=+